MKKSIYQQFEEWSRRAWADPQVRWRETWLENGFCSECRFCCGPQPGDSPYPMPLLRSQIAAGAGSRLHMLDASTAALDERGCRALGETGCTLERRLRPVSCGLFPLVLTRGRLVLYSICPASLFIPMRDWFELARKVSAFFSTLEEEEVRRLSIDLSDDFLSERCTALPFRLFQPD